MAAKRTTEKQRVLVEAIAFATLALYGYYLYILQPLIRAAAGLSHHVGEVARQVQGMERVVAESQNVQQEYARLKASVEELRGRLPSENELPSVIERISELASQTGVKILSIFPQRSGSPAEPTDSSAEPTDPSEDFSKLYKTVAIEIDALSGFHQFGVFLSRVEFGEQPMEVQSLQIRRTEKELRRHSIRLVLVTYVTVLSSPSAPEPHA